MSMSATLNRTLSTAAFYVLLAMMDRTLHGYGIRDQIAHDSEGDLVPAMGTIYPLLDRLVSERLLERVVPAEGNPRIVCRYQLTALGRRRLEGELSRLERVVIQARYKLGRQVLK